MTLLGQLLIGLNYCILWGSRFAKKKRILVILDSIAKIPTILGFLCLGNYNGVESAIFSFIRNIGAERVIKHSAKTKAIVLSVFLAVMIAVYLCSYQGIATIFILINGAILAFGIIMLDTQGIRITGIIGSALYICFDLFSGVYLGALLECITIIILIVSFIKYKRQKTCRTKETSKDVSKE